MRGGCICRLVYTPLSVFQGYFHSRPQSLLSHLAGGAFGRYAVSWIQLRLNQPLPQIWLRPLGLSLCTWNFCGEIEDIAERTGWLDMYKYLYTLKNVSILIQWSVSSVGRARCWYTRTLCPKATPRSRVRASHGPLWNFFFLFLF